MFTNAIEGVEDVDTDRLNDVVGVFEDVSEPDMEFERL